MSVKTPIAATTQQLAQVRYNADGLVPAIVQEEGTGDVLMMAWMNEETLSETLESGRTVFWSRSRQARWRKGDSSGDHQWVRAAYYDCDGDTLLFVVQQAGAGACHTGNRSCFYRSFGSGEEANSVEAARTGPTTAAVAAPTPATAGAPTPATAGAPTPATAGAPPATAGAPPATAGATTPATAGAPTAGTE